MKNVLLVLVMLLSMTSAFAQRTKDYTNVNCRQIKDTVSPTEFAACCRVNPHTCGNANGGSGNGQGAHCPKGWLEVIKCGYGIDYKNCGCLPKAGSDNGLGAHCPKGWLEVIKCGYGIDYKNCGCLSAPVKK